MLIGSMREYAKLSWQQALEIIQIRSPFNGQRLPPEHPASISNLARIYGVSNGIISKIANHKSSYSQEIEFHVNGVTSTKKVWSTHANRDTRADVG